MKKTVAIVQSNYIPWKGYFDLIGSADEFILLDDVTYTRRDWRNRNKIKTPDGSRWLTIPVQVKGRREQKICETKIDDPGWTRKHWKTISTFYPKAAYFDHYREPLEELYLECEEVLLSRVNYRFLRWLCENLGITTRLSWSMDHETKPGKTARLVSLCQRAGATEYLSGPLARAYLDEEAFESAGIKVRWMDYTAYPEYRQLYPPFDHRVSVVDLLLNEGPEARRYMRAFRAHVG